MLINQPQPEAPQMEDLGPIDPEEACRMVGFARGARQMQLLGTQAERSFREECLESLEPALEL